MQSKRLKAFFVARAHCWVMFSMVSICTPRTFPAKLLSSQLSASLYQGTELFLSCRLLLNLMSYLNLYGISMYIYVYLCIWYTCIYGIDMVYHIDSTSIWYIKQIQFCIICKLTGSALCPTIHIMKILNNSGCSISPQGMPLLTGCQLSFMLLITTL